MRLLSAEWSLQARFSDVKSQLVEANGEPVEENGSVFRWEYGSGVSDRVVELDRSGGCVRLDVRVPEILKYLLIGLAGVFVVGVVSERVLIVDAGTVVSLILTLVFREHIDPPRHEDLELSSVRVAPYYFGSIGLCILFASQSTLGSDGIFQLIYVGVGVFILLQHYAQGSLPIESTYLPDPKNSQTLLYIPILGLIAPILAYALFNLFNFLRVSQISYQIIVPVVSVSGVVVTWGYMIACRDALNRVRLDRNAAYQSRGIQYLTLVLYVVANTGSLLMLMIWIDLLSFGISGDGLVTNFGPQGVELLSSVYTGLDGAVEWLPVLPPRMYSMLVLSTAFLPVLMLLGIWLVFLTTHSATKYWLLSNGYEMPVESVEEDGVTVLCVDTGRPMVKPFTVLFGLKRYVVVDQSVVEKLSGDMDELNAVISHEFYHLRRRESLTNVFTSFVSIFAFGGKNALLSFYNYPQIEEDADRHAVKEWGQTNLITALRKLEDLQVESTGVVQGALGLPGFISFQKIRRDDEDNTVPENEREQNENRLSLLLDELIAPYRLFYGSVLFDVAHRPLDERIEFIAGLDDD